jgi:hypothetical protein
MVVFVNMTPATLCCVRASIQHQRLAALLPGHPMV